jgi:peptide/nickel transport system permease protein
VNVPGAVGAPPAAPTIAPARSLGHPLAAYVMRRVGLGVVTLLVISLLIFLATSVLPGDTARVILGRNATPEAVAELRERLDLDRPRLEQYLDWLSGLLTGDLGRSAAGTLSGSDRSSVASMIAGPIANSLILGALTLIVLVPLGIGFGIAAARRRDGWFDRTLSATSVATVAIPEFVTGAILITVFAVWLKLLPAVSLVPIGGGVFDAPTILVLPLLTLLAASFAQLMRIVRGSMLDVLGSPYVEAARLNGLPERRVVFQYGFRNALAPTIQVTALLAQWLVGGIIITETIFSYPGIGQQLAQAVSIRDIPYVQSVAMLIAGFYVFVNIVADIAVVCVVPRLRSSPPAW